MKYGVILFLACLLCIGPALAMAGPGTGADTGFSLTADLSGSGHTGSTGTSGITASSGYLGGDIQLGSSGSGVTVRTTAVTQAATAVISPATAVPVTGSISVTTTPAGAFIFIDGVQRGISPATIPGLTAGSHTVLLKRDGYQDLSAPVTVVAGGTQEYTTGLSPITTATTAAPLPAPTKTPGFAFTLALAGFGTIAILRKIP